MGEAKRRRKAAGRYPEGKRSWATGVLEVSANEAPCFTWSGTKRDAMELQKQYLESVYAIGMGAVSYAKRAAGYLICFGMPQAGEADRRPSRLGETWSADEIEVYKAAILWLALREHIPNTGQRIEDVFVGERLLVTFNGDQQGILDYSIREFRGEPLPPEKEFTMMAAVLEHEHRLDPHDAISLPTVELFALAGVKLPPDDSIAQEPVYVPRIPINAAEADAMLGMMTVLTDISTPPNAEIRTYAGYTDEELAGGKPTLKVK